MKTEVRQNQLAGPKQNTGTVQAITAQSPGKNARSVVNAIHEHRRMKYCSTPKKSSVADAAAKFVIIRHFSPLKTTFVPPFGIQCYVTQPNTLSLSFQYQEMPLFPRSKHDQTHYVF